MKYKKLNKKAVSLMISYVLLISIVLALSVGVFSWLKIMANVEQTIDCKDDTSLVILDYKCNPSPKTSEPFTTKNLELTLKNNGRFNIDGVIVTVSPTDSTPINYLAPDKQGGEMNGHYFFPTPLEPQQEKTISFINNNYTEGTLKPMNFNNIEKIELQPFIIHQGDKFERIVCQNAVKRISISTEEDCTIISNGIVIPTPVAHYKFDQGIGTTVIDSEGDNNGITTDATWVDDSISGKAIQIGESGKIEIQETSDLDISITNSYTISGCFKLKSKELAKDRFFWEDQTWSESGYMAIIYGGNQGLYYYNTHKDSNGDQFKTMNVINVALSNFADKWVHIVQQSDIEDGKVTNRLYINGELKDSREFENAESLVNNPNKNLRLALDLHGQIDEVKIWQEALSEDQIKTEYENYNL